MTDVTPADVDYWCPVGTSGGLHFHAYAEAGAGNCMNCGAPVYDADDGTKRWKRKPYLVYEDDDVWGHES